MKNLVVIPARYNSNRLVGKPLVKLKGKTLVERAVLIGRRMQTASKVIVLTDDDRIFAHCEHIGVEVYMTPKDILNGTERLAFFLEHGSVKELKNYETYSLLQVDEPTLEPSELDKVVRVNYMNNNKHIGTLHKDRAKYEANTVYLSQMGLSGVTDMNRADVGGPYRQHIGFYVYPKKFMKSLYNEPNTPKLLARDVELLKSIELGFPVASIKYEPEYICGVNLKEELDLLEKMG